MAKGKKRPAELPEYGTVMMKGVQYYRTRITDADGKRVAIYGLTREELYDRVEDAQKKIAEVVFHRENPTVEEYCEKWLLMRSGTVRTNTLEGYARMVNRYIVGPIGQMYMDEVTTDDLRLLMVPLSKGSSGMYGQLNMLIKNIFNSAEESKVIKENPSKTICARGGKPAKRREALTDTMDFKVTPHMLRHTYITNLIYKGVDPKTVQYLAGHENSKTTMDIYAKVKYNKPEELSSVVNAAFGLR